MLASFTSTDSESENPPLGNPLRFRAVENRSNGGAQLARLSLTYVVLVAGVAGLSSKPLAWRRTPKFKLQDIGLASLVSTAPEILIGSAFVALCGVLLNLQEVLGGHFVLVAVAGSLSYATRFLAAPVMAMMSERHLKRDTQVSSINEQRMEVAGRA